MSNSGSGTVINYGSGSGLDFLTTYGSGSTTLITALCIMGGGSLEPRTAIELSFSAWGGLGKPNRGRGRGETFFPDSGSDRDSHETFQISRNLGLVHVEFICNLDSQPCLYPCSLVVRVNAYYSDVGGGGDVEKNPITHNLSETTAPCSIVY
jgi:hypothetical protein